MGVRTMRRVARWVLSLCVAAAAWSCGGGGGVPVEPPDESGESPVPVRVVTGFISDATTGGGLAGATVRIGDLTATTGADGLFSLPGVPRLDQTVTITLPGYQTITVPLAATDDRLSPPRLIPSGAGTVENPPSPPDSRAAS